MALTTLSTESTACWEIQLMMDSLLTLRVTSLSNLIFKKNITQSKLSRLEHFVFLKLGGNFDCLGVLFFEQNLF